MKQTVVIIGGGLGGLLCGNLLARAGRRVIVLEQGRQPGGCIQSYRRAGQTFDTGFHYVGGLGAGMPLHRVFRSLGLLDLPWRRMDEVFDEVHIGRRSFAFCQGYDAFAATLAADFPAEREALHSYARLLRRVEEEQLSGLSPHTCDTSFQTALLETGAWSYLTSTFGSPLLVDVLGGTSLKMELRRRTLPLFTFLHGNAGFVESGWRLEGGGAVLAEALADGIRRYGGEVRCGTEVVELMEEDGCLARACCADGTACEGDAFISSLHPAQTCTLVKQSTRMKKVYRRRISRMENTGGMFTASLLLRPQSVRYFGRNLYVYRRPSDVWSAPAANAVDCVMVCCRLPEGGGEWVRQVDLLTPMPWTACQPWERTKVGHRGDAYRSMKQRTAEACLHLAERVVPGLRDSVEACFTSTPLTYRDYVHAPQGTAYGLRKDCGNPLETLLSPRTPIPNLYLTGQSLAMHGVQGVTMTALFTCAEITGKEWIWKELI